MEKEFNLQKKIKKGIAKKCTTKQGVVIHEGSSLIRVRLDNGYKNTHIFHKSWWEPVNV